MEQEPQTRRKSALSIVLLVYMLLIALLITWSPFLIRVPETLYIDWEVHKQDLLVNLLLLTAPGFLWRASRWAESRSKDRYCLGAIGFGLAVSLVIEGGQLFMPYRATSPIDVIMNILGAWLGARAYDAASIRLDRKMAGQLAFELPLMVLFYLITGLLLVTSFSIGEDVERIWMTVPLGAAGAAILVSVWQNRLREEDVFTADRLALVAGLWFFVAIAPGALRWPSFAAGTTLLMIATVRLSTALNWMRVSDSRRFELPTLTRVAPIYAVYLLALTWWPWVLDLEYFSIYLELPGFDDGERVIGSLRNVEYALAFTLIGYMTAEARGRALESRLRSRFLLASWCGLLATLLGLLRGFHPYLDASISQIVANTAAGFCGGVIYWTQIATVQRWLGVIPEAQREKQS